MRKALGIFSVLAAGTLCVTSSFPSHGRESASGVDPGVNSAPDVESSNRTDIQPRSAVEDYHPSAVGDFEDIPSKRKLIRKAPLRQIGPPTPTSLEPPPDPDNIPVMLEKWDLWHRRVAELIFTRFDSLARQAFPYSRPLKVKVSYTVTRDKQIVDAKLVEKSPNLVFNGMALMVLKSMSGNPMLEFPEGSCRVSVERVQEFTSLQWLISK